MSGLKFWLILIVSTLPFIGLLRASNKANLRREERYRQFFMPIVAAVLCIAAAVLMNYISQGLFLLMDRLVSLFSFLKLDAIGEALKNIINQYLIFIMLILFNTLFLGMYVIVKKIILAPFRRTQTEIPSDHFIISKFYEYDKVKEKWHIQPSYGQARTFLKVAYYGGGIICFLAVIASIILCRLGVIKSPFYPVFALIIMGELAFYLDGLRKDEVTSKIGMSVDNAEHITAYAVLRKSLGQLFSDKCSSDGTSMSEGSLSGDSIEDVLSEIDNDDTRLAKNYSAFIRNKIDKGMKADVDYVRSGYELALGKSLLFNTPFYYKLSPYVFYAMSRTLLKNGKVLIVLGRHGTEDDLLNWCEEGMKSVSNIPELWKMKVLNSDVVDSEDSSDIGIITRTGVHDINVHRANHNFLRKVSFVFIVEPSRLVASAQVGLNLLIKCFDPATKVTYCSVDKNSDGLVDSMSHILMTSLTEVAATDHAQGMSSYMCWTSDEDYLQHRITSGISRYLGMGTEFSFVALKNQVSKAVWYGGDAFPVLDMRWIAKQYYHELLEYANLPATQEAFDKYFKVSHNVCDERVSERTFVSVEDEYNNLFEVKREFSTISEEDGFVNVISSEYMLREYMTQNEKVFLTDPKAIPYLTADYARTRRNAILSICLELCVDGITENNLRRELELQNIPSLDTREMRRPGALKSVLWREICELFCPNMSAEKDSKGRPVIVHFNSANEIENRFEQDSILLYERRYNIDSDRFENYYFIENIYFKDFAVSDLTSARYVAEEDEKDQFFGTELKGHIVQKYLPGQLFTLNGKYYEILQYTAGMEAIVRRASEHIVGRPAYRQIREYNIHSICNSDEMGALKTVKDIDMHYQMANFDVTTSGYWKLRSYNDFKTGQCIIVNGIPKRSYVKKQILKLDFAKWGDAFTESVRKTITILLNEVFKTLFADNQPFISAVTMGNSEIPMTYSITRTDEANLSSSAIYIIEDSQLDIGLLSAVERNVERIFNIISDYLAWNDETIRGVRTGELRDKASIEEFLKELEKRVEIHSAKKAAEDAAAKKAAEEEAQEEAAKNHSDGEEEPKKRKWPFGRKGKKKTVSEETGSSEDPDDEQKDEDEKATDSSTGGVTNGGEADQGCQEIIEDKSGDMESPSAVTEPIKAVEQEEKEEVKTPEEEELSGQDTSELSIDTATVQENGSSSSSDNSPVETVSDQQGDDKPVLAEESTQTSKVKRGLGKFFERFRKEKKENPIQPKTQITEEVKDGGNGNSDN